MQPVGAAVPIAISYSESIVRFGNLLRNAVQASSIRYVSRSKVSMSVIFQIVIVITSRKTVEVLVSLIGVRGSYGTPGIILSRLSDGLGIRSSEIVNGSASC